MLQRTLTSRRVRGKARLAYLFLRMNTQARLASCVRCIRVACGGNEGVTVKTLATRCFTWFLEWLFGIDAEVRQELEIERIHSETQRPMAELKNR
jgi:hypothetical protein